MATIPLTNPYAMRTAVTELAPFTAQGAAPTTLDDYTDAVSEVKFVPTTSVGGFMAINGKRRKDQDTPDWNMVVTHAQDDAATSLHRFLISNAGKRCQVKFYPRGKVTGSTVWTAEFVAAPGDIGGAAGNAPVTSSVTMAVNGDPVASTVP